VRLGTYPSDLDSRRRARRATPDLSYVRIVIEQTVILLSGVMKINAAVFGGSLRAASTPMGQMKIDHGCAVIGDSEATVSVGEVSAVGDEAGSSACSEIKLRGRCGRID